MVAVFYKVLHSRLADIREGKEETRRKARHDSRDKSNMFPVKQLEQARLWLVAYLNSAMENPTKKFKLDIKKYPAASVITDASPEGLGGGSLGEQQSHTSPEVADRAEGCRAAEVPVGRVSFSRNCGSIGDPGCHPALGPGTRHVQCDLARAIGQLGGPGPHPEDGQFLTGSQFLGGRIGHSMRGGRHREPEGNTHSRCRQHYGGLFESSGQTTDSSTAAGVGRRAGTNAGAQGKWILCFANTWRSALPLGI